MSRNRAERCVRKASDELGTSRSIPPVVETNEQYLDEMRLEIYRKHRLNFLAWLYMQGRNPYKGEGYSAHTVYETNYRTAEFERFTWDRHDEYIWPPTREDAAAWNDALKMRDIKSSTKGKAQEAVQRLFEWRHHEFDGEQWEIDKREKFDSTGSDSTDTPDYLDRDERRKIRDAVIDYCGDWKRVSMVWSSLDVGFRPVEVRRAKQYWFRPDEKKVIIPAEETSKDANSKQTRLLSDQGAEAVRKWLASRDEDSLYDETEAMWLTTHGNPYSDKSLNRLMDNLAREASIETLGRKMTWYAIRHSVGTYVTKARDLKAAKQQLGHENVESTMRYDNVSDDDIRDVLDKMG